MPRVLVIATTTGYQTRAFGKAASDVGVDLVFATDRCYQLDNPWRDDAVPVRFHDEPRSVAAIGEMARRTPVDGVLAVGDRPAVLAALAAVALGVPGHPPGGVRVCGNKLDTRRRLQAAGLPCPPFRALRVGTNLEALPDDIAFPCVVKPLALSGSRGVIRANSPSELRAAVFRVCRLLARSEVRQRRDPSDAQLVVETFIPGREYALEGVMENGVLHVLALFDKPDPLEGPFFEETIYVTPSAQPDATCDRIVGAVTEAARALGLHHGPVHAECRVNEHGVFVLEIAARPIGGLCARALKFSRRGDRVVSLEELLLRHALGEPVRGYRLLPEASAVMMIPIPRAGVYRQVKGASVATAVPGVVDLVVTAKPDQRLEPLPEGASYLGFIFARAENPADAVRALRQAHDLLDVVIDKSIPVV
ncbi:MAG TPA: carboxylate--amine ligase [Acidobacteria bacterium]|jgi:biotin carboxylase|nr:carboxylate--amine ligase [Acidobacteriota bacterium]